MSITTMEQLIEIPTGSEVRVDGIQWQRTAHGLMRDGYTVVPDYFEGAVQAGLVQAGPSYAVGSVFTYNGLTQVVATHLNEQGRRKVARFTWDGVFLGLVTIIGDDGIGIPVTEDPAWVQSRMPLVLALADSEEGIEERNRNIARLNRETQQLRDDLAAALGEYIRNQGGLTAHERTSLENVMEEHNLELPAQDVAFTVEVTGRTERYMDGQLAEFVGGDVSVDMPLVNVEWTKTLTGTIEGRGCVCEDVDDEWVRGKLTEAGVRFIDGLEFEVNCDNG